MSKRRYSIGDIVVATISEQFDTRALVRITFVYSFYQRGFRYTGEVISVLENNNDNLQKYIDAGWEWDLYNIKPLTRTLMQKYITEIL